MDYNTTPIEIPILQDFSVNFSFLKLNVIREYIAHVFKDIKLDFQFDLENIIDDIILLNFIVGNDFLPHLPGYNVKFAGVDMLIEIYKNKINYLEGYLTDSCNINLKQLEKLFTQMSINEQYVIN